MQPVELPEELRSVSRPALEAYVGSRVRQFSRVLAGVLLPGCSEDSFAFAVARTQQVLGLNVQESRPTDSYVLRFTHRCRFLGCMRKDCPLCKNNPNKKCREDDNYDECFADGQVLKSKCEADVYLELVNLRTGAPEALPGVDIAVSVVDGESYNENASGNYGNIKELLKNDDGSILLGAYQAGSKTEADGRMYLRMKEGQIKLPDICVTDKNDTFHLNNETFGTFRMMARAVRRDGYGHLTAVDNIRPAVSGRFIVKTQRALNDYRKSEYPHYRDELTKLKHIGSITAQRLREIQQHLDCPYTTIETVEQLKQLMQYADQNRQVENKMLELLNMKGKHKHKWDYLREVLGERVVYDDMLHRLWHTDESMSQGVIFTCKQGQINMDRPIGLVQRTANGRLVVTSSPTGQEAEMLKQWRALAETGWHTPGHRGWSTVQEQLEMVNPGSNGSLLLGSGPSMNVAEAMDEQQQLGRRGSMSIGPSLLMNESARSRRSSAVSYQVPNSPDMNAVGMFGMQQQQQQQQARHLLSQQQQQHQAVSSSYGDGGAQLQGMAGIGGGGQPPFPFGGGRTAAALANELMPDVYRTASAPNMAAGLSTLYSHNSVDSTAAPGSLLCVASGPVGASGTAGDGVLPPPPVRNARYRRLSADTTAARQMAMLQSQQNTAELTDLSGKRSRVAAPGHASMEELQMQYMQQPGSAGADGGGNGLDAQHNPPNRQALYHFESRGRHTPRSRLSQDLNDTGAMGNAMGTVLDTSDIESYLAQNFSFITGEPTFSGAEPSGAAGAGSSVAGNSGGLAGPSPSRGLSGPLMQMSLHQPDQHDPIAARLNAMGASGSGLSGFDLQQQQHNGGMGLGTGGMPGGAHAGLATSRSLQHSDSGGAPFNQSSRELKRCESDSFKRFLAIGLPFAPLEATPEDLFEGLRRDSGAMGE